MQQGKGRTWVVAMAIAVAATGVGSAWAEAASAQGLRQWRFGTARHLPDSRTARISDGDYFSGRARFIDTYVAASRQRFRNSRRGPRKRVYLIRGTLAIKNKPGFDVLGAECSQKSPRGTNMLLTNDTRAFFPRPANHIEQRTREGSVGLSVKGFSVSLPFPAFTYYASTSVGPNVRWSSLSSSVHNWTWAWDDGRPNDVLLGYAGYWQGPAKRIKYAVRCRVVTVNDDDFPPRFSKAVVRMKRKAHS